MLITKEVEVELASSTVGFYEEIGYDIFKIKNKWGRLGTPRGTKIIVKVGDLKDCSSVRVDVECDNCGKVLNIIWENYRKYVKKDDKYYCKKCSTKLKNNISFYDWCYKNLTKEKADEIISRWDEKLNNCNPNEVSFRSTGKNGKGYWFKCLKNLNHIRELKNINSFTRGNKRSIECSLCNSIFTTHPKLIKYFVDKKDAKKYSFGSDKKICVRCPDCGNEKMMNIDRLVRCGFSCNKCGDGISYPEKIMINILNQMGISYQTQLNKTTFKWCNKYRYDFYIPSLNCIIEIHGGQHYYNSFESIGGRTVEEEQKNDEIKEQLAKENEIKNYIVIDCRKSELEWIKNNILNSDLNKLFDLSNVNWLQCHEFVCNGLVKKTCDMWDNGMNNTKKISDEMQLNRTTILKYLKQGVELGWCNYNAKESSMQRYTSMSKKVICLNTNEVFNSIKDVKRKYNINISNCCRGVTKSAGKHPETGEPLVWMYYEDYIKQEENKEII